MLTSSAISKFESDNTSEFNKHARYKASNYILQYSQSCGTLTIETLLWIGSADVGQLIFILASNSIRQIMCFHELTADLVASEMVDLKVSTNLHRK